MNIHQLKGSKMRKIHLNFLYQTNLELTFNLQVPFTKTAPVKITISTGQGMAETGNVEGITDLTEKKLNKIKFQT